MDEGNGTKVVIGCCSAVAVVAVAVALSMFVFGKKGFEWLKRANEDQQESLAALEQWENALSTAGGDVILLSPSEFAGFERSSQESDAPAPGLSLGKSGQLDSYTSGAQQLTVWIAEVRGQEFSAIVDRIKEQNGDRFSSNSNSSIVINGAGRLSFKGSPPEEQGLMVSDSGWAMLLQVNDHSLDLQDLLIRYARAAAGQAPVVAPEPKTQPEAEAEPAEAIEPPANAVPQ